MKRRGFLKLLGAAPIAVAAPKILAAEDPLLARYTYRTFATGFALPEVVVTPPPRLAMSGILTRAEFARQLQEGLNEVFSREYRSEEWREMFEDRPTGEEWKKQYECMPALPVHRMRIRSEFCRDCGMSLEEIVNRGDDYCYGGRER